MSAQSFTAEPADTRLYRQIWRWHFYAGLFCIPFVIILSITGTIYLFKPQIEAWLDGPYDHLGVIDHPAAPSEIVAAAVGAIPGSNFHSYELPGSPGSAVRVIVGKGREEYRAYVHPGTLSVLKVDREDARPMRVLFRLHGELLLGDTGSMIVELAASWTIVMILTGLYLWWPRQARGIAGVLYPRLGARGRFFWKDLHAVAGFWISGLVLFMLVSGLPWAKQWGGDLKAVRGIFGTAAQDWSTGRSSEIAERRAMDSDHSDHRHGPDLEPDPNSIGASSRQATDIRSLAARYAKLDHLVIPVSELDLARPVLISPPNRKSTNWTARSDAQNRPLRTDLVLDGDTGRVLSRLDFDQRPLIDRMVGVGVAAHEGQLFGWPNQILGVITAFGLLTTVSAGLAMWVIKKRSGTLGAPARLERPKLEAILVTTIVALGILLPLLGISILLLGAIDQIILSRLGATRNWLRLNP